MSDDVPLRCCTKCRQELPATTEFFYRQFGGKYGLKAECKACIDKRNKPYVKNYSDKNKSDLSEYQKARRQTSEGMEYQKAYYQRPEVRERQKAEFIVRANLRRSRKLAVTGTHTTSQIRELLKRQKHECYYCSIRFQKVKGKYIYHVDHTFPLSRVVGTDIPANDISYLVLACPTCNRSKKDKFPWEFPEGGRLL